MQVEGKINKMIYKNKKVWKLFADYGKIIFNIIIKVKFI